MTGSLGGADAEVVRLLQTVWDLLSEGEHWPSYTAVDRVFHRRFGLDVDAVLARAPESWLLGGRPAGGASPVGEGQVSLTVEGAALCEGSDAALAVVARAARLAADAEAAAGPADEPVVQFAEAVVGVAVPAEDIASVARASGLLLVPEPWAGHVVLWETGWRMTADRRARPFAAVEDLAGFWAARDAAGPGAAAGSGTGTGEEIVLSRRWRLAEPIGGGGFGQVVRAVGTTGRRRRSSSCRRRLARTGSCCSPTWPGSATSCRCSTRARPTTVSSW